MAIAVIVHPSNESIFDMSTVKKIYLGKKKSFSNGRTAIVFGPIDSDPALAEFNEKVMEKSNSQIKAYWSKVIFTGAGTPPMQTPASEMISEVSSNPDAIGYVDRSLVTDAVKVAMTI